MTLEHILFGEGGIDLVFYFFNANHYTFLFGSLSQLVKFETFVT